MARSVRRNETALSGNGSLKEKPTGGRKKKNGRQKLKEKRSLDRAKEGREEKEESADCE
jgi:hypothetical protein